MNQSRSSRVPGPTSKKAIVGRRQLLKALVAAGGAITASSRLPARWVEPVIEVGLLPAHAQVSPVMGNLTADLTWVDANVPVNLNLRIKEPDDTQVSPTNPSGPTLIHSGDDISPGGGTGQEIVENVVDGVVSAGTYEIFIDWPASSGSTSLPNPDPDVNLIITTHKEDETITSVEIEEDESVLVATVSFPTGTITKLI